MHVYIDGSISKRLETATAACWTLVFSVQGAGRLSSHTSIPKAGLCAIKLTLELCSVIPILQEQTFSVIRVQLYFAWNTLPG